MKKLDLKTLPAKLMPALHWFRRYRAILFIVGLVCTYSVLVLRINMLSSKEPSDTEVTAKLQAVHPPKLDSEIVTKIEQLKDNSVEVKALFNNARANPFQE